MLRADVDTAICFDLPSAVRRSPASFLLYVCIVGISAFITIGPAPCSAQDVADAARQERARKEEQKKKPKHIFTDEDLKRAQILLPADREQVDAKENQSASANAEKSQDAADAEPLPANAPLGDVARHFQRQKDSRAPLRDQQFTLPLVEAPVLASPKPVLRSLRPTLPLRKSVAPPFAKSIPPSFIPFRPPVRRSPFARPKFSLSAPPRILDSKPARPSPTAPSPAGRLGLGRQPAHITPVQPAGNKAPTSSTKVHVVTVKRGDTLWKLARQSLGVGSRWRDVLAVNPRLRDANRIEAGSQILLPNAVSHRTFTTLTVRSGDSLSRIARARFGDASFWACIARANPSIADPNLIYDGQTLTLPPSCPP